MDGIELVDVLSDAKDVSYEMKTMQYELSAARTFRDFLLLK